MRFTLKGCVASSGRRGGVQGLLLIDVRSSYTPTKQKILKELHSVCVVTGLAFAH